ncbi:MAG TPA: hypothetical protein VF658_02750 [Pyrinomonadaceae bacterium]|jgi:hypothetical protein
MAEVRASEIKAVETIFRRFSIRAHPEKILQETSNHFFYHPDRKKHRARPRTNEATTTKATSLACLKQSVTCRLSVAPQLRSFGH